jgi:hypothetical protein
MELGIADHPGGHAATRRLMTLAASAVLVVAFLLRLPALAEPIGIDQGIFITAGWGLRRGLALYRDLWDQKPPGTHLTYLLGLVCFGGRATAIAWLDILATAGTTLFLIDIGRRKAGWRVGFIAGAAFSFLALPAGIYRLGGFLERAVPETFIALFISAAVWASVLSSGSSARGRFAMVAGVLIGAAAVYKPIALVYSPIPLLVQWPDVDGRQRVRSAILLMAGVAVVPATALVWLAASGTLRDAWIAVVEYNRAYLTYQSGLISLIDRFAHEVVRRAKTEPLWTLGTLACPVGVWRLLRTGRLEPLFVVALAWWAAALLGAAANGIRLFNSYFIPSHPALALLAGTLVSSPAHSRRSIRLGLAGGALLLVCLVGWRGHFFAHAVAMTRVDVSAWWSNETDAPRYLERFGGYKNGSYSARANAELAADVGSRTGPNDRIYIFGMAASVYFMAQRLPANRFLWAYPPLSGLIHRPGFDLASFAHDLNRAAPVLFVFQRHNRDSRTGWRLEDDFERAPIGELLSAYKRTTEIEDFEIFQRR